MLKRHLMTHYQMTPDQYRAKWGLPADYPMVAPNYAEQRRELAKKIGLGRQPTVRRGRGKRKKLSIATSSADPTPTIQPLMHTSYAAYCLKKKKTQHQHT